MREIAEGNHPKHPRITGHDLWQQFAVKLGDYLGEHQPRGIKRRVAEEDPCQAYEMEGQHHRANAAPPRRTVVAGMAEEMATQPLVDSKSHTVKPAPKDEVETRAMPESAKQHGDNKVDVGAKGALAVAAEGDVDIVANP